jgi:TctA family transporter
MIPSESNYASTFPWQEFFQKGKAYFALKISLYGILFSTIFSAPFVFVLYFYSKQIVSIYPYIIVPILGFCLLFLIVKKLKNIFSIVVILLSGALGYVCLRTEMVQNPLFILVGGLFGLSASIYLLKQKHKWVQQTTKTEKIPGLIKNGVFSNLLSLFVTFFPGLGSGFAAVIGNELKLIKDKIGYFQIIGGISISVMIFSFLNIYFTGKARTGSAYYLPLQIPWYYTYIFAIIFVVICVFIALAVGKLFVKIGNKIGDKAKYVVPIILFVLAAITTNWFGILVFILCGLTGYICIISNNSRTLMMVSIIFPVLLFFI